MDAVDLFIPGTRDLMYMYVVVCVCVKCFLVSDGLGSLISFLLDWSRG